MLLGGRWWHRLCRWLGFRRRRSTSLIVREWLVIESSMKHGVFIPPEVRDAKGYIPRDVAETLLGRNLSGMIWFTREESKTMRTHPKWRDTAPANVCKGGTST